MYICIYVYVETVKIINHESINHESINHESINHESINVFIY